MCFTTVALFFSTAVVADDWKFGIGTGLSFLAFSGDGGFQTKAGTADFHARMAPNEVREITESAYGVIGFAEKGKWTINYLAGRLELGEDITVQRGADTGDFDITYTREAAEVLVDYAFSNSDKTTWSMTGGIRYSSQDYDGKISINGTKVFDDSAGEDWTDAVVGIVHDYAISPTTSWTSRVNANFGESEGGYQINTRVNWLYGEHWEFRTFVDYREIDFQQGDPGDSDYFLFDAEEIRFGGVFLYLI
jgi:hypothetical protein